MKLEDFKKHKAILIGYAKNKYSNLNSDSVDDIIVEVVMQVHKDWREELGMNYKNYLMLVFISKIKNLIKHENFRNKTLRTFRDLNGDVTSHNKMSSVAIDKLHNYIDKLLKEEQILIKEYYWGKKTQGELAQQYKVTQQAIAYKLSKIINKLRGYYGISTKATL